MEGYCDSYSTHWNVCRSSTSPSHVDADWEPTDYNEDFVATEERSLFAPNLAEDISAPWISRDHYQYDYGGQHANFVGPLSYHDMVASGYRPIVNFGTSLQDALTEPPRSPRALPQDRSHRNRTEDSTNGKDTGHRVSTEVPSSTWYIAGSEVAVTSATSWSNVYGGNSSSSYNPRQDTGAYERHQRGDTTPSVRQGLGISTSYEGHHPGDGVRYGHSVYDSPYKPSSGPTSSAYYSNDDVTMSQDAALSSIAKVSPEPSEDHHHHAKYADEWGRPGLEVHNRWEECVPEESGRRTPGSLQHRASASEIPRDRSVDASHSPECPPQTQSNARSSPMTEQTFTGTLELDIQKKNEKKPIMACLFCRERKIACGPPPLDSEDRTCKQCKRRKIKCEYPTESHRGQRRGGRKKKAAQEMNEEASG